MVLSKRGEEVFEPPPPLGQSVRDNQRPSGTWTSKNLLVGKLRTAWFEGRFPEGSMAVWAGGTLRGSFKGTLFCSGCRRRWSVRRAAPFSGQFLISFSLTFCAGLKVTYFGPAIVSRRAPPGTPPAFILDPGLC